MDITPHAMMQCRVENLERLARRLGVPIPPIRDEYARRVVLSRELDKAIMKDRIMAEAAERQEAEAKEQRRIAAEIADVLGETGPRPKRQILRILQAMGEEWVYGCLSDTLANPDKCAVTKAGAKRTDGGRFFAICREEASGADMPRAEFFRCFFRPAAADSEDPEEGSAEANAQQGPRGQGCFALCGEGQRAGQEPLRRDRTAGWVLVRLGRP